MLNTAQLLTLVLPMAPGRLRHDSRSSAGNCGDSPTKSFRLRFAPLCISFWKLWRPLERRTVCLYVPVRLEWIALIPSQTPRSQKKQQLNITWKFISIMRRSRITWPSRILRTTRIGHANHRCVFPLEPNRCEQLVPALTEMCPCRVLIHWDCRLVPVLTLDMA